MSTFSLERLKCRLFQNHIPQEVVPTSEEIPFEENSNYFLLDFLMTGLIILYEIWCLNFKVNLMVIFFSKAFFQKQTRNKSQVN